MAPVRNKPAARNRYLDAARDCIVDIGWRRTTLTEVARRAGVSRMTIYRSWADMSALVGDLLTREWAEVGDVYFSAAGSPHDAVVQAMLHIVRAMRHNRLYQRILELDPELILPYLLRRRGRVQEHLLQQLLPLIRAGQAQGEIRAGDADTIARTLLMATQGFTISARIWIDDTTSEDAIDADLALLLDRTLRP